MPNSSASRNVGILEENSLLRLDLPPTDIVAVELLGFQCVVERLGQEIRIAFTKHIS